MATRTPNTTKTTRTTTTEHGKTLALGYWRRNLAGLEQRRLRAASMFDQGASQAEVARALDVSRQAASVWHARWRAGGAAALASAGRQGRRPQLSAQQRAVIDQALRQGARAHGFASDWWTLERVAQVIWRLTGVRHHPGHVWRVLRQMRWSLQRPARRALERDEAAIRRWVATDWPRIREKRPAA